MPKRCRVNECKSEHVHIARATYGSDLCLVRGGKQAYLWFGGDDDMCAGTVSGAATLRAFAKAILREVGE